MNLTDLCLEVNNWFDVSRHFGKFEIKDGTIDLDFLSEGQYFRIIGSVFNDGVHQYPTNSLIDETFDGAIWAMAVPLEILRLKEDIANYATTYEKELNSPYQSESISGFYSYSKGDDCNWQNKFKSRLNRWRKI